MTEEDIKGLEEYKGNHTPAEEEEGIITVSFVPRPKLAINAINGDFNKLEEDLIELLTENLNDER